MARTDDDEREVRLRPRRPRVRRNEAASWSSGFRLMMHFARTSRKASNRAAAGGKVRSAPAYHQRCAVRVTYLNNRTRGQWKAHGRYLARESATFEGGAKAAGFNRDGHGIDLAENLQSWQTAEDQRLWKLIVSPEFGDRVDLSRLTRDLMACMERELATELEWAAVEHHNTEHAHVHLALRGRRDNGDALHLNRQFIQNRIREIAGDLCTRQLGYRTERDAQEAEWREITAARLTSLDRRLARSREQGNAEDGRAYFDVARNPVQAGSTEGVRIRAQHEAARLAVLQRMGLSESTGPNRWRVRRGFDQILQAMQQATDRQRTLAAHGVPMSDERLPVEVLDLASMTSVEGRVLVHGQDENSGRNYLMVEATDAKVYFVHYTREMEEARSRGELRTNSFVRLKKLAGSRLLMDVVDLGDAERLLTNPLHLGDIARDCVKRGVAPFQEGWGGWLGRYQTALCKTMKEIGERRQLNAIRMRQRGRDRSRGR
jgi:type IV secretory pathway VirD2 relaxase